MVEIDRMSPLPLYHQLKQLVISDIKRRELRPGDRIAGDHELCILFGISRTVVRQALSELEASGVIERINGRGTFVAQPKTAEGLAQSLTGLFEDVASRGQHVRSEVRRLQKIAADEQIAKNLQIELGESVIVLERLRFVDDLPWALTTTHISFRTAPGLLEENLSEQSLYALLREKYGLTITKAIRTLEATTAGSSLSRDLQVRGGAAIMVLRSTGFDDQGTPIDTFVAYHRGDRSKFEVMLKQQSIKYLSPEK